MDKLQDELQTGLQEELQKVDLQTYDRAWEVIGSPLIDRKYARFGMDKARSEADPVGPDVRREDLRKQLLRRRGRLTGDALRAWIINWDLPLELASKLLKVGKRELSVMLESDYLSLGVSKKLRKIRWGDRNRYLEDLSYRGELGVKGRLIEVGVSFVSSQHYLACAYTFGLWPGDLTYSRYKENGCSVLHQPTGLRAFRYGRATFYLNREDAEQALALAITRAWCGSGVLKQEIKKGPGDPLCLPKTYRQALSVRTRAKKPLQVPLKQQVENEEGSERDE